MAQGMAPPKARYDKAGVPKPAIAPFVTCEAPREAKWSGVNVAAIS